LIPFLLL